MLLVEDMIDLQIRDRGEEDGESNTLCYGLLHDRGLFNLM